MVKSIPHQMGEKSGYGKSHSLPSGLSTNRKLAIRMPCARQFEMHPTWVPSLDGMASSARILFFGKELLRFERTLFRPQEFETCPGWGATTIDSFFQPERFCSVPEAPSQRAFPNRPSFDPIASAIIAVTKLFTLTASFSACFVRFE